MNDNEIRVIGGENNQKKYFCKAFAVKCPCFEDTGLCGAGDCIHADEKIPSSDEMLRLQLIQMRRTQYDMGQTDHFVRTQLPHYKPKTR